MAKKAAKQAKKTATKSAVKQSVRPLKTAKKSAIKTAAAKKQPGTAVDRASLTHRLDALLHTMRCIAQHEDELCTLLHDARRSGKTSTRLLRELHTILEELPADDYTFDLDAVREMVTEAVAA